jgi:acyl-CoA thioesterase
MGEPPDEGQRLARACAEAMYAGDAAAKALGIEVLEVRPGYARASLTVTAAMLNGHAICHGGYLFLLADTAFAYACNTYGPVTVAAAADIVFTAPAREGDELLAEAVERTRFGRSGVYDATVRRRSDGVVVAEFRGRSRSTQATLAR